MAIKRKLEECGASQPPTKLVTPRKVDGCISATVNVAAPAHKLECLPPQPDVEISPKTGKLVSFPSAASMTSTATAGSSSSEEGSLSDGSSSHVDKTNSKQFAQVAPDKQFCLKGKVYLVKGICKRWDGKQWRKVCESGQCTRLAVGATAHCKAHGGGKRCQMPTCEKSAVDATFFCKAHGGGKRCKHSSCGKSAVGRTPYCKAHGGGRRCGVDGCSKSAVGSTCFCIAHGGGKRCQHAGCSKSARGSTEFCIAHGGGKRCKKVGCTKSARGASSLCNLHSEMGAENFMLNFGEDITFVNSEGEDDDYPFAPSTTTDNSALLGNHTKPTLSKSSKMEPLAEPLAPSTLAKQGGGRTGLFQRQISQDSITLDLEYFDAAYLQNSVNTKLRNDELPSTNKSNAGSGMYWKLLPGTADMLDMYSIDLLDYGSVPFFNSSYDQKEDSDMCIKEMNTMLSNAVFPSGDPSAVDRDMPSIMLKTT